MEEVFQCPRCGKDMTEGKMLGGYGHHLSWLPKGKKASWWNRTFLNRRVREGSLEDGFYLVPMEGTVEALMFPAHICPECKLVILDYDREKVEYIPRWYDDFLRGN